MFLVLGLKLFQRRWVYKKELSIGLSKETSNQESIIEILNYLSSIYGGEKLSSVNNCPVNKGDLKNLQEIFKEAIIFLMT